MNSNNFMRVKYFFKLDTDKFILKCFNVNQLYMLLLIFDILQMKKECFPQMTRNVTLECISICKSVNVLRFIDNNNLN